MIDLIDPHGMLNKALIADRETLYTGMNGQRVERLVLVTGERVIYKPLTNDSQSGREAWVYAHVLPSFPPIYPRLLAYSQSSGKPGRRERVPSGGETPEPIRTAEIPLDQNDSGGCWCLFEDLGPLSHEFEPTAAAALIPYIAKWHALPIDGLLEAPLRGPKPMIEALLRDVLLKEGELRAALIGVPSGHELLAGVLSPLRAGGALPEGWGRRVLSHGDLHLGNYAMVNGAVKVLDWEHVHLNNPYWDLYHLLDLSHPVFPKRMDAASREHLIDLYLSEAGRGGAAYPPAAFKRDYDRFAAVFSLWMLLLIEKDLAALDTAASLPAKWSPEQLLRQRAETLASFVQCAARLD